MSDTLRALGGHDTTLSNMGRVGCIVAVDGATARVQIGDTVTDFLPLMVRRAFDDAEWWQPAIGEQVVVLCLWGDVSQGVILGSISQDAKPNAADGTTWGKRFRDGTTLTYDPDQHTLTVNAGGADVNVITRNVTLKAQNATVDVPNVYYTGSITAAGDVVAGGVSLIKHVHGGVKAGGDSTSGPEG